MNGAGGRYWSDEQAAELRRQWLSRPPGQTMTEFATGYGLANNRTRNSVAGKIRTLELTAGGIVPVSRYETWDNPPLVEGDVLILGDCHIPYHNAEFIEQCLGAASRLGVRQLILAGDALDVRAFSNWPEDFEQDPKRVISSALEKELLDAAAAWPKKQREQLVEKLAAAHRDAGDVGEEIAESRAVLRSLDGGFDRVLWIMGNHEARVTKTLKRAMSAEDVTRLFMGENPKWQISAYYFCNVVSEGEPYQIEHPMNAGKGSSKRLVPKYGQHIVMLHNHHFSVQSDPSGRWLAIEPGMCADERRVQYVGQRHNAADTHVTGAVIIRGGKCLLLNRFTDWSLLTMEKR